VTLHVLARGDNQSRESAWEDAVEQWPYIVNGFEAVSSMRRLMPCILHSHGPQRISTCLSPLYCQ